GNTGGLIDVSGTSSGNSGGALVTDPKTGKMSISGTPNVPSSEPLGGGLVVDPKTGQLVSAVYDPIFQDWVAPSVLQEREAKRALLNNY
ncbi:MAG TPA: hypothetical protein VMV86_04115, partial [Methanosarcinales archaeon]|nr:hypothetical protein [Methanosarcinales archaeon]